MTALPSRRADAPEEQVRREEEVRRLAYLLDEVFRVPGTSFRFGIDAIAGFVPLVGDYAGLVLSTVLIGKAIHLGARWPTVLRMLLIAGTDATIGAIPVVGTIIDFFLKANTRNVRILESHALDGERTGAESIRMVGMTIAIVTIFCGVLAVLAVVGFAWLLTRIF